MSLEEAEKVAKDQEMLIGYLSEYESYVYDGQSYHKTFTHVSLLDGKVLFHYDLGDYDRESFDFPLALFFGENIVDRLRAYQTEVKRIKREQEIAEMDRRAAEEKIANEKREKDEYERLKAKYTPEK